LRSLRARLNLLVYSCSWFTLPLHDAQGRSYEAVYDVVHGLRRPLGMPTPYDVIWPGETFETALAYDLPPGSTGLTLSLPFGPVLDVDAVLASTR
jgi:hypothetical protein